MMPRTITYAAAVVGAQEPINLDYLPTSDITAAVTPATPADTYAVQVSLDDVFDQDSPQYVPAASARWFPVTGFATTLAAYLTFQGPWRAIRLNVVANTTGVTFQVGQATTPRA